MTRPRGLHASQGYRACLQNTTTHARARLCLTSGPDAMQPDAWGFGDCTGFQAGQIYVIWLSRALSPVISVAVGTTNPNAIEYLHTTS